MRLFIERPNGDTVQVEGGFTKETAEAFLLDNHHDATIRMEDRPREVQLRASAQDVANLGLKIESATETAFVAYYRPSTVADAPRDQVVAGYPGADVAESIRKRREAEAAAALLSVRRREEDLAAFDLLKAKAKEVGGEILNDDGSKRQTAEQALRDAQQQAKAAQGAAHDARTAETAERERQNEKLEEGFDRILHEDEVHDRSSESSS